jgi:hypothetical protein
MLGISACRDLQSVGHFSGGMFVFHRFHHRKTLSGTSADTAECERDRSPVRAVPKGRGEAESIPRLFLKCHSADADSRFPVACA